MTGIGFLGAGVILSEGLNIRGLTTSASIWMTASIGIMIGVGLLFPALIASIITLGTISVFRWVEDKAPTFNFARLTVRFSEGAAIQEDEFQEIVTSHDITCSTTSYLFAEHMLQYEMTIRTRKTDNFRILAEKLDDLENVHDFSIVPSQN